VSRVHRSFDSLFVVGSSHGSLLVGDMSRARLG
jgi:hypothetical protein